MTTAGTADDSLQEQCELGSELLMQTRYMEAEAVLAGAEARAWAARDWDTLARVYMPLQEARRQRRQRCGEGVVKLDWISQGPEERLDAETISQATPGGQLLVAGWASVEPASQLRSLAAERGAYLETFLAAVYPVVDDTIRPTEARRVVVIVPAADAKLPDAQPRSPTDLAALLPPGCLVSTSADLPAGERKGDTKTFAEVMALWERLHRPFLADADAEPDLVRRIDKYRRVIGIDYACEFAHQRLSNVAAELAKAS